MGTNVIDVSDADFETTVIEGSRDKPVVVDMWAAWCGPCRVLGPILEKVADERDGDFLLAKLDVDMNPRVAAMFGVQSIPTVVAFKDGEPVTGFIGSYPEEAVNEFIDSLLPPPDEADEQAEQAEEVSTQPAPSETLLRADLEKDPADRKASLALARILLDRGDLDEAEQLISPSLPEPEAAALQARITVARWSDLSPDGSLAEAKRAAAEGRWREALDRSLSALEDEPDEARQAMLTMFLALGEDEPLVPEYRRRLTNALF
jgi:putative thioredoxin